MDPGFIILFKYYYYNKSELIEYKQSLDTYIIEVLSGKGLNDQERKGNKTKIYNIIKKNEIFLKDVVKDKIKDKTQILKTIISKIHNYKNLNELLELFHKSYNREDILTAIFSSEKEYIHFDMLMKSEKIKTKLKLTEKEIPYFVFQNSIINNAYNPKMDNINILLKNGTTLDIKEAADTFSISALATPVKKWFLCFMKI